MILRAAILSSRWGASTLNTWISWSNISLCARTQSCLRAIGSTSPAVASRPSQTSSATSSRTNTRLSRWSLDPSRMAFASLSGAMARLTSPSLHAAMEATATRAQRHSASRGAHPFRGVRLQPNRPRTMRILAIETSCDETAIAIVEATGDVKNASFTVLGNALLSQVAVHQQYGGVYPNLAKREHAKNLVPILEAALEEVEMLHEDTQALPTELHDAITKLLEREPGLDAALLELIGKTEPPVIDVIAVTAGPGLEPALWVGINFAKALALAWGKPLVAVNHMEGHILAGLAQREAMSYKHQEPRKSEIEKFEVKNAKLPALVLLISGGHTELVLMKEWLQYELIGQTRDDAVGEAFDKVARMLGLPYPGGPEISRLAESARLQPTTYPLQPAFTLPRPMIDSGTCDFSFAGLKTAVLYLLKKIPDINEREKQHLAHEFENAVADVLWKKTALALEQTSAQTLVIGGGVSANTHIRRVFKNSVDIRYPQVTLRIPTASLTTDNAVMIAIAGYYHASRKEFVTDIVANGNLSLAQH